MRIRGGQSQISVSSSCTRQAATEVLQNQSFRVIDKSHDYCLTKQHANLELVIRMDIGSIQQIPKWHPTLKRIVLSVPSILR
jgi:hypothetical protein